LKASIIDASRRTVRSKALCRDAFDSTTEGGLRRIIVSVQDVGSNLYKFQMGRYISNNT
jgi:hypothetical protein